jgi:hypothetical protein
MTQVAKMTDKKPTMPGGLTREEFNGLREDLQQLLSSHPRAKFTVVFLDGEGRRTDDMARAKKYGLTVHEEEKLVYEEFGDVFDGKIRKR